MATAMAFRALAISKPPSPPLKRIHKPQLPSLAPPPTVALLSFLSVPGIAFQANALTIPKDDVVSSLIKVEETIDRLQDFGSKALGSTQSAIDALVSALRPGVDVALPALREALKAVSPVVSGASEQATEALRSAGVDPAPVYTAAKTVADAAQQTTKIIEVAKPIASSAVQTISSTDPSVFVASAGALFLAYLLLPPIWSAVSFNLRGYKGTAIQNIEITLGTGGQLARAAGAVAKLIAKEGKSATLRLPSGDVGLISKNCLATVGQVGNVGVNQKSLGRAGSLRIFHSYKGNLSPAQSLDLISTQNFLMIDIRSELDKNKAGIPRLPSSAKNKIISIPLEELPAKIKSLVRDAKKVEAEFIALKISYLKRVNRGSNIVIMDSYCNTAKIVAKALTSLGFKNCWVMADGFSGGRGWQQSRLGTDSYNVSIAEVLSPSRIIPAARARFGTVNSSALRSNQKLLPGSSESR